MNDTAITIRRPIPEEWSRILEILETANFHCIGGPEMRSFPLDDCFIAVVAGDIVGVAGYEILDGKTAKNTLLAIDPMHRHKGIGSLLQRKRITFLRQQGIRVLIGNCDDPSVIAWNMKHFGFRDTGERIAKQASFGRRDIADWVHLIAEI